MTAYADRPLSADVPPGVTRFDLACQPRVAETVLELIAGWAEDRALPEDGRRRVACLMGTAIEHGMRFEPRALTISVRWVGAERIRVDLRWYGTAETARPGGAVHDLAATISTLDALAVDWGMGRIGNVSVQWIVSDTT